MYKCLIRGFCNTPKNRFKNVGIGKDPIWDWQISMETKGYAMECCNSFAHFVSDLPKTIF